jgi:hypothetical protein
VWVWTVCADNRSDRRVYPFALEELDRESTG